MYCTYMTTLALACAVMVAHAHGSHALSHSLCTLCCFEGELTLTEMNSGQCRMLSGTPTGDLCSGCPRWPSLERDQIARWREASVRAADAAARPRGARTRRARGLTLQPATRARLRKLHRELESLHHAAHAPSDPPWGGFIDAPVWYTSALAG